LTIGNTLTWLNRASNCSITPPQIVFMGRYRI
jgi:hypothetical protein